MSRERWPDFSRSKGGVRVLAVGACFCGCLRCIPNVTTLFAVPGISTSFAETWMLQQIYTSALIMEFANWLKRWWNLFLISQWTASVSSAPGVSSRVSFDSKIPSNFSWRLCRQKTLCTFSGLTLNFWHFPWSVLFKCAAWPDVALLCVYSSGSRGTWGPGPLPP